MTTVQATPGVLLLCIGALFVAGIITLIWGSRIPKQAQWPVWTGLFAMLIAFTLNLVALFKDELESHTWARGWIWRRDEIGAITVGLLQDHVGLLMSTLTVIASAIFLTEASLVRREARPDRYYAALAISTSGVVMSWIALTPWIAFVGLAFAVFGGLLALGSHWNSDAEARIAARFGWERSWGLLFSILGACVLASSRLALSWTDGKPWGATPADSSSDIAGATLLAIGLVIQLFPFPFLGSKVPEKQSTAPGRILLTQIFPAWAVFALLVRLEPQLRVIGVFPSLGWAVLVATVFTIGSGLLQSQWQLGLSAWLSAGFTMSVGVLACSGPLAGMSVLLGVSLAGAAVAAAAPVLQEARPQDAAWSRVAVFLAAAAGTGVVGFVSAGGAMRWLVQSWESPALAAGFTIVFFCLVLLGWKMAWTLSKLPVSEEPRELNWLSSVCPYFFLVLSLGSVWTGTASGGAIYGNLDQFAPSLLARFFGPEAPSQGEDAAFASASWLYWGALVLAIATAYWTTGGRHDAWSRIIRTLPRFSAFLIQGYGIGTLFQRILFGIDFAGRGTQWLLDKKIWNDWMPIGLVVSVRRTGAAVMGGSQEISRILAWGLRRWVEVPAKLLQLVQSGDVQWYLFFAVGTGIAILIHFLKI